MDIWEKKGRKQSRRYGEHVYGLRQYRRIAGREYYTTVYKSKVFRENEK